MREKRSNLRLILPPQVGGSAGERRLGSVVAMLLWAFIAAFVAFVPFSVWLMRG